MAANIITQFVLKQFAKKSGRKTGISQLLKASDPIVQSNVRDITIKLKNMGIDPERLTSTDDVLQAMNYHQAMVDQHLKKQFDQGIKSLEKEKYDDVTKKMWKDRPFTGVTLKVVDDKTIPVTIKGEKTKESPRGILDILLGKKRKAGDTVAIAEEIKAAYPQIQLTGKETFAELKEMLKHLDEEGIPFESGGLAYLLGEPDYMKAEGGRVGLMYGGDPGFAFEYGGSWADWQDKHKHAMPIEDYVKTKMPKERLPFRHLEPADSLGYDEGGKVKKLLGKGISRRTFLGGLLSLFATPFMKFGGKEAAVKATPKVVAAVANSNAAGKPPWLDLLIARVIREGDDMTAKTATSPQQTVHRATLPESGTPVEVTHDLTTGSTIVDIGEQTKHGWSAGRHGQPARLVLKKGEWIEPDNLKPGAKGTKTKDEFLVEEAEFTGGHPENVKFEETVEFKYGDHGSDFSEIEQYATKSPVTSGSSHGEHMRTMRREGWYGKKDKAHQLAMDKKHGLTSTYKKDPHVRGKQADLDDWAEGRAESMAEDMDPEFASGGIAHLLGE
jgi:hypothetical protein